MESAFRPPLFFARLEYFKTENLPTLGNLLRKSTMIFCRKPSERRKEEGIIVRAMMPCGQKMVVAGRLELSTSSV